jgi:hypothetical protein
METSVNKTINEYRCNICNKDYTTRAGIWKHTQKYHVNNKSECSENTHYELHLVNNSKELVNNSKDNSKELVNISKDNEYNCVALGKSQETTSFRCRYCNKIYKHKQSRSFHEKTCSKKEQSIDKSKDQIITMLQQTIKEERELFKQQLLQLMNKNCKVHPKTLQKINNQLNADTINNTVNSNNNNITYNIIALGHEDLTDLFTKKEKLTVLKNKRMCLDYLVKYTHFNDKYPQFKNIMITNTQNDLAYKFDKNENKFVAIGKEELINDLMDARISDITLFYEELDDELDENTKKIIDKFLEKMDDDKFKDTKKKDIKLIIYNNRDKVSKDLEIII